MDLRDIKNWQKEHKEIKLNFTNRQKKVFAMLFYGILTVGFFGIGVIFSNFFYDIAISEGRFYFLFIMSMCVILFMVVSGWDGVYVNIKEEWKIEDE